MRRLALTSLCLLLLTSPLALAQLGVGDLPQGDPLDRAGLERALDLGASTVQRLDVPAASDLVSVDVTLGGELVTLVLERHSVRAPGFRTWAVSGTGQRTAVPSAPVTTFRGWVAGLPGSRVGASLEDGALEAVVVLGPALPTWAIQPARPVDPDRDADEHVIYSLDDILARDVRCADPLGPGAALPHLPEDAGGAPEGVGDYKVCEVACAADVEYYQLNNSSVAATQSDIEKIINRCETIYEDDVQIQYEITELVIHTSEPDPYNTSDPGALLNQFRNEWNANQQDVPRDIAHLFTGKEIDGSVIGIAWLGVICDPVGGIGYGLSQSLYTGNIANRTALTAHEIGHNWNAGHCDSTGDCRIMCSGLGGCSGDVKSFGPSSVSTILGFKNAVGCLSPGVEPPPPPAPTLTGINPTSVSPLGGVTVSLYGTTMQTVETVQVGEALLGAGDFTLLGHGELLITTPPAESFGPVDVIANGVSGPSNAITLDYAPPATPIVSGPSLIYTQVDPVARWSYAADPSLTPLFLISLVPDYVFVSGYPVLSAPFLAPLPLGLDAVATGQLEIPIPVELGGTGLFFSSQIVFVDGGLQYAALPLLTLVL